MRTLYRYSLFVNADKKLVLDITEYTVISTVSNRILCKPSHLDKDETISVKESYIDNINNYSYDAAEPHLILYTYDGDRKKNTLMIFDFAGILLQRLVQKSDQFMEQVGKLKEDMDIGESE